MPDRTSPIALRRLEARDLAAALAIQAQSYPACRPATASLLNATGA